MINNCRQTELFYHELVAFTNDEMTNAIKDGEKEHKNTIEHAASCGLTGIRNYPSQWTGAAGHDSAFSAIVSPAPCMFRGPPTRPSSAPWMPPIGARERKIDRTEEWENVIIVVITIENNRMSRQWDVL